MNGERLNVSFKGERDYIQGGDIFNAINERVGTMSPFGWVSHLAFRSFCRNDCELHWNNPGSEYQLVAQGTACFSDGDRQFWIIETDEEAAGRRPFDEDKLVAPALSEQNSIELRERSEYTPIEEVIALTKRLSYELASDVEGKWVFGQLDLKNPLPQEYSSLRISRTSIIGNRFSVNAIEINGAHLGDIRFIVGSP